MGPVFAMSLPALVLLLAVVGAVELALGRRSRLRSRPARKAPVAAIGFDALGIALAPSRRHKLEHDAFQDVRRDDEGDGAPPRSRVDLDARRARIVVPRSG